jgi:hypothetical protein
MNYSIYLNKHLISLRAFFISALLLNPLFAADFGVADWGMSPDEVKNLETRSNLTPFGVTDYLIFSLNLPGIEKTRIVYQFKNSQLVEGRFLFMTMNPLDITTSLVQYSTIKTMMSGQYGPPNVDKTLTPTNDDTMASLNAPANELASDRLILKTSWSSQSAKIQHQLAWNIDRPHHQLHYVPIESMVPSNSTDAF